MAKFWGPDFLVDDQEVRRNGDLNALWVIKIFLSDNRWVTWGLSMGLSMMGRELGAKRYLAQDACMHAALAKGHAYKPNNCLAISTYLSPCISHHASSFSSPYLFFRSRPGGSTIYGDSGHYIISRVAGAGGSITMSLRTRKVSMYMSNSFGGLGIVLSGWV